MDGGAITYAEAYPSTDLRYDVLSTGIKETLVLRDAEAPTTYRFRITMDGQKKPQARRLRDGSWSLSMPPAPDGTAILERPTVVEAGPSDREVNAPDESAKPRLDVRRDGEELLATVAIDPAWLSAPDRRFPVTIDPTLTIQPTVEDMFWTNKPNFSGNVGDRLFIGGDPGGSWRAGLKFDTSSIPAGVTVSSASLQLRYDGVCIAGPPEFCGGTSHQDGPAPDDGSMDDVYRQFSGSVRSCPILVIHVAPGLAARVDGMGRDQLGELLGGWDAT